MQTSPVCQLPLLAVAACFGRISAGRDLTAAGAEAGGETEHPSNYMRVCKCQLISRIGVSHTNVGGHTVCAGDPECVEKARVDAQLPLYYWFGGLLVECGHSAIGSCRSHTMSVAQGETR